MYWEYNGEVEAFPGSFHTPFLLQDIAEDNVNYTAAANRFLNGLLMKEQIDAVE